MQAPRVVRASLGNALAGTAPLGSYFSLHAHSRPVRPHSEILVGTRALVLGPRTNRNTGRFYARRILRATGTPRCQRT